jgi:hypothetical protein
MHVAAQIDSVAKKQKQFELNGYVDYVQDVSLVHSWIINNTFLNRLNVEITPFKNAKIVIGNRNRLLYGDAVRSVSSYAHQIEQDNGFLQLSKNLFADKNVIFNTSIDRLFFDFTHNKFQGTIGRQRINWGQTFAWNPNDVFNTYSFFDVNYVERKGCDALRLQYFTGVSSRAELAAKLDLKNKTTIAGLYKCTPHNTDVQVLAGYKQDEDLFSGFGFSGNVKGTSLRGELTALHSVVDSVNTKNVVVTSVGFDHSFRNSLSLQGEFLFNSYARQFALKNIADFYTLDLSVKTLSIDRYSILLSAHYPLSPLINLSLSGMYFVDYNGFFINPGIRFSVSDNLDFSLIAQYFNIAIAKQRVSASIVFGSLKWSF